MRIGVVALVAGLAVSACGSAAPSGRAAHPPRPPLARSVPAAAHGTRPRKVLLFVEENQPETAALAGMPRLRRLADRYGRATHYEAITHPSLPNYLALAGGSTFGVRDDADPSAHRVTGASVFDQAIARHHTAKTYAESMPSRCDRLPAGRYAVKHNPWTYFGDARSRANCRHNDVPLGTISTGALHRDAADGRLPTIGMVIPNLCDDAHDCSLSTADSWLHRWLRLLRDGPDWRRGRLAIVVTFDENDGRTPNTVLTVVLSRRTRHVVTERPLSHYSWTRYADSLIGARPLRQAAHARSLGKPFHL